MTRHGPNRDYVGRRRKMPETVQRVEITAGHFIVKRPAAPRPKQPMHWSVQRVAFGSAVAAALLVLAVGWPLR